MNGRYVLNKRDGKIMGVAAGLSDFTGIDPLIIRLGLIVLAFVTFPAVPILYVLTGWLAANR